MALFQKKPITTATSSLYTTGLGSTILVIGLGNIGREYAGNRHNVGFMILDRYAAAHDFTPWTQKKDLRCYLSTGSVGATQVILAKPTTMMNRSGEAAQALQQFYKIQNSETLVVYDELDIDFGTLQTRSGGGAAGHNGVKSLIQYMHEDFGRIRVGIGPKTHTKMDSADFVLANFSDNQFELLPKILREICAIIDERTAGPLLDNTIVVF